MKCVVYNLKITSHIVLLVTANYAHIIKKKDANVYDMPEK